MRFSKNGYYLEKYIKCFNCGVLIVNGKFRITDEIDEQDVPDLELDLFLHFGSH